jgi:hypothetical protein
MIQMNSVKTKRVIRKSKHLILSPTSISLTGEIDNKIYGPSTLQNSMNDMLEIKYKESFVLELQDLNLNLSPQMLNTSLKMMNSIQDSLNKVFLLINLFKQTI